jgi:hypothetical protein
METEEKTAATGLDGFEEIDNPFGLMRPTREVSHVPITDPAQPGKVFWLSLRYLDAIDYGVVADETERMIDLYITGRDGKGPGPFPLVGDRPVDISERLFQQAAMVSAMQAPSEESKQRRLWNTEYLVAIALTMPFGWRQLLAICQEINTRGKWAEGNSSTPAMAP